MSKLKLGPDVAALNPQAAGQQARMPSKYGNRRVMLVVELPWPPTPLWPNRRAGWRELHENRKLAKSEGYFLAQDRGAKKLQHPGTLPVTIIFCAPSYRKWDVDNALAALKGYLDGIAAALGIDDTCFEPITLRRGPVGKPGKVTVAVG